MKITDAPYLFDFTYGGRPFQESLTETSLEPRENGERRVYRFANGLKLTTDVIRRSFGAVEWVNTLENEGDHPTDLIENLWDCCVSLPLAHEEPRQATAWLPDPADLTRVLAPYGSNLNDREFSFDRYYTDSFSSPDLLFVGTEKRFASRGGRSSHGDAPFFNVHKTGAGYFLAVGWTGQWNAVLRRETDCVVFRSGLETTRFRLLPGESFRTSSVVILPYEAPLEVSFNLWRRLVRSDYSLLGQPGRGSFAPFCLTLWGGMESAEAVRRVQLIHQEKLPVDTIWMDAGWYGMSEKPSPDEFEGDWGEHTGDWRVNPYKHPDGLLDVSRAIHDGGKRFLLWVEPERVRTNAPIVTEHPEYFYDPPNPQDDNRLLNLGRPDAFSYCLDTLSELIRTLRIDCYRQDFNMEPLATWRHNDAPDRVGVSEIKHINALYRLWDALLSRFDGLLIDNCASGGRRIDVETLRRSIPLWRSDMQCPANQRPEISQTHGLQFGLWLPFSGTNYGRRVDRYAMRSAYAPGMNMAPSFSARDPFGENREELAELRALSEEYLAVRPYLSADFYPLTLPGAAEDGWCALQYHDPCGHSGVLLVFRRKASPYETARFRLHGVCPDEVYRFSDADSRASFTAAGEELLRDGVELTLKEKRSSRVIFYKTV